MLDDTMWYYQEQNPSGVYCMNGQNKKLDLDDPLEAKIQADAEQILQDNAYNKYKSQVLGDLPWYFIRNLIVAIGALNYHKQMSKLLMKNKEEEDKNKKEKEVKKEGAEYEPPISDGGIEMSNLKYDDYFVKFA